MVASMAQPVEFNSIFDAITKDPSEAAQMRFRADMMLALRGYFQDKGWDQKQIGTKLGVKQPRVSELMNGKIHLFSSDLLVVFLAKLGFRLAPAFTPATKTRKASITCTIDQQAAD